MILTVFDAFMTPTFAVQIFMCMAINFGVNFGITYATMSKWGTYPDKAAWPGVPATTLMNPSGTCLLLEIPLSAFLIGYMCTLLATGGLQKDVRMKKCDVLDPYAIQQHSFWRYTPANIRDLCLRSFAQGVLNTVVVGFPTFLLMWASIGRTGKIEGYNYCVFKGVWSLFLGGATFLFVFPAAINKANYPELEFEELVRLSSGLK